MYIFFTVSGKNNVQFIRESLPDTKVLALKYGQWGTWGIYVPYTEEMYDKCVGLASRIKIVKQIHREYFWTIDVETHKDIVQDRPYLFKFKKEKTNEKSKERNKGSRSSSKKSDSRSS